MALSVSSSKTYEKPVVEPVSSGLIHKFEFDGDLTDTLGNATIYGTPTMTNITYGDDAYHGTYISGIPNTSNIGWTSSYTFGIANPVSFAFWSWLSSTSDMGPIVVIGDYVMNSYSNWHCYISQYKHGQSSGGYAGYYMRAGNTNSPTAHITTGDADKWYDSWHHLVGVVASQTSMKLYVDGILIGTATASQNGNANSYLSLGLYQATPATYRDLKIATVRVFNRALTDAEVQTLYENT